MDCTEEHLVIMDYKEEVHVTFCKEEPYVTRSCKEENEETLYIYEDIPQETIVNSEEEFTILGVTQPPSPIVYEANEAHVNGETNLEDARCTAAEDEDDEEWQPGEANCTYESDNPSSDEDWEPKQTNRRKRPVNKSKKNSITSTDRVVVESHTGTEKDTGFKHPQPRRTVPLRTNYKDNGLADCDETIFCFECGLDYVGDCPVHGPLVIIVDTPVAADIRDEHRAMNTVPPMILVKFSAMPEAGSGVWAREQIPARVRFGPCEGQIVSADVFTPFAWVIRKNGQPHHCLDATEPGLSNWMRYVNCARHRSEQNLAAFQYRGGIYYQTIRAIKASEELLVWYGDDYGTTDQENEKQTKFECPGCPCAFSTELFLKRHEKYCRHHDMVSELVKEGNNSESESSEVDEPRPNDIAQPMNLIEAADVLQANSTHEADTNVRICISETNNESEAVYKCETCSEWFFDEKLFKTHRKTHPGAEDEILLYHCPKCERIFTFKYHLVNHIRIQHNNDTPYKCNQCDKRFGRKTDLSMHARTHVDKGFTSCEYCNKTFLVEERYKTHLAKHREGLFVCPKCNQEFVRKSSFEKHVEKHNGGEQYTCGECNKTFSHKRYLGTHMRSHNGEQPYSCTECGKRFSLRENYMRHRRSHTGDKPFACEKCGKRFAVKANLQNHEWTHSEVKPHICNICSKRFAEKNSLTRHLRVHSGEKPYICSLCDKRYARKHHLKEHLKQHLKKGEEVVFVDCENEIHVASN